MLKEELIELKLRVDLAKKGAQATTTPAAPQVPLQGDDQSPLAPLSAAIDALRAAALEGADRETAERLGTACATIFNDVASVLARHQREQQAELVSLISVVRETAASLGSEHSSLHSSLTDTTERFQALTKVTDPARIKAQLVTEVTSLRRMAEERRKAWDTTMATFNTRVAKLEGQLVTSQREASIDPLTGIANRRFFDATCKEWLAAPQVRQILAILDVDNFKTINDTHGHAVGDKVLVSIAKALSKGFRSHDVVARIGGDEFAVLATDLTLQQAESRFTGVIATIAKTCGNGGAVPFTPTVSCGVVEFSAGDTMESVMVRSDQALYESKRLGKNRVTVKARPYMRDLMRR
jgi:diguanylate cyclase